MKWENRMIRMGKPNKRPEKKVKKETVRNSK